MSKGTGGYVILVRFRAKAGQDRQFAKQMLSVVPVTRSEPGNRQFEFYVDQDDPLNFMLYEEFVDEAALRAHRDRREMAANLTAIKPMLDGAPDATFWTQALTNAGANGGSRGEAAVARSARQTHSAMSVNRAWAAASARLVKPMTAVTVVIRASVLEWLIFSCVPLRTRRAVGR